MKWPKKLAYALFLFYATASIVFWLFSLSFPDPATEMTGQRSDKETIEAIRSEYHLDKPIYKQYALYLNDISFLSLYQIKTLQQIPIKYLQIIKINKSVLVLKLPYLRRSFQKGQKVGAIISKAFLPTAVLALSAILIAIVLGTIIGFIAAINKYTLIDRLLVFISTLGISVPSFFSAILVSWFFGYVMQEYIGLNMTGSFYDVSPINGPYIEWKNLILPAITLGIRPIAVISQLVRGTLIDEQKKDYYRSALAKGLNRLSAMRKHLFVNTLIPVSTAISGWFASLLAGAFFVEYIFNWRGLGKTTIDALEKNDMPVVMGSVLLVSSIFIFINLIMDVIYPIIDPRLKK